MKHLLKIFLAITVAALCIEIAHARDCCKQNTDGKEKQNSSVPVKVGIVAHRGYWNCEEAGYARNSIAALKCAQDAGFWGSEFDVNMTSDEVLLVYHDDRINGKVIDKNPYDTFKDVTIANGEKIPTLDDYLVQAKKNTNTVLVFEFKSRSTKELEDRMVDLSLAKLKEYGLLNPKKVIFISFSINICEKLAKDAPKFTVQFLADSFSPDDLAARGINGVDYHHNVFSVHKNWYFQARKNRMSINAWTVNKAIDMQRMLDMGVDYITTDNPMELRELIKSCPREEMK